MYNFLTYYLDIIFKMFIFVAMGKVKLKYNYPDVYHNLIKSNIQTVASYKKFEINCYPYCNKFCEYFIDEDILNEIENDIHNNVDMDWVFRKNVGDNKTILNGGILNNDKFLISNDTYNSFTNFTFNIAREHAKDIILYLNDLIKKLTDVPYILEKAIYLAINDEGYKNLNDNYHSFTKPKCLNGVIEFLGYEEKESYKYPLAFYDNIIFRYFNSDYDVSKKSFLNLNRFIKLDRIGEIVNTGFLPSAHRLVNKTFKDNNVKSTENDNSIFLLPDLQLDYISNVVNMDFLFKKLSFQGERTLLKIKKFYGDINCFDLVNRRCTITIDELMGNIYYNDSHIRLKDRGYRGYNNVESVKRNLTLRDGVVIKDLLYVSNHYGTISDDLIR